MADQESDLKMGFWNGKSVLLTGHTGFKGAWLTVWLHELGATVTGYALPPESTPNLYDYLQLSSVYAQEYLEDVRELSRVQKAIHETQPDIVIHLAAQSLVRRSYRDPLGTFSTNIMGTANLLEACREAPHVRALVVVTSDKCYHNQGTGQAYQETDPLGGHDPYSASKAAAEWITHAYRASCFADTHVSIATARAGNVIGGGDWSEDRLIPDAARAFAAGETLIIRAPHAHRPWQHVVEPLWGYLLLAQALYEKRADLSEAYNFGPNPLHGCSVTELLTSFAAHWTPAGRWRVEAPQESFPEAEQLRLDASRAARDLGWKPLFSLEHAVAHTAAEYHAYALGIPPEAYRQLMCSRFPR